MITTPRDARRLRWDARHPRPRPTLALGRSYDGLWRESGAPVPAAARIPAMTCTATAPGNRLAGSHHPSALAAAPQAVRLDAVARTFAAGQGRHEVLRELDLELRAGEIVAVIGPSGC